MARFKDVPSRVKNMPGPLTVFCWFVCLRAVLPGTSVEGLLTAFLFEMRMRRQPDADGRAPDA